MYPLENHHAWIPSRDPLEGVSHSIIPWSPTLSQLKDCIRTGWFQLPRSHIWLEDGVKSMLPKPSPTKRNLPKLVKVLF